jgi:hypothetical protein
MTPIGVSSLVISAIVLASVFGGALLGMALRPRIPEAHLAAESRDIMRVAMGLVGTVSALVLGLLVASAKSAYDTRKNEVTSLAARVVMLDRALAHYGPEAKGVRALLGERTRRLIELIWREELSWGPEDTRSEIVYDQIQALVPQTEAQQAIKEAALEDVAAIGEARWLMYAQRGSAVSTVLLVTVVFWLTVTFVSFGLLAPRNKTVVATLFVCALSVSGAILLILELDHPFHGLIRISDAPMRDVVPHLGQ